MRHRSASTFFRALVTIGVLSGVACNSGSTPPIDNLAAARARWARVGPATYSYTIQRSCECTAEMTGPVLITVRNGIVESRQYRQSGAPVPTQFIADFPPVEGLFGIIDGAVRDGIKPLTVQYDPALGYPTRIALGDPAADAPLYLVSDLRAR